MKTFFPTQIKYFFIAKAPYSLYELYKILYLCDHQSFISLWCIGL